MFYLYTDFGNKGPYVGELHSVINKGLPSSRLVDLMHDAPVFNPQASAYLLAALASRFDPGDACLAVVDPGVGDETRKPLLVNADGILYCGPDNGLLSQIIKLARNCKIMEILWRPENLSDSFHGRDLFAPALIQYLNKIDVSVRELDCTEVVGHDWPTSLTEIIYIDSFGNCITGVSGDDISINQTIQIKNQRLTFCRTFSEAKLHTPFWYVNSMGLVEIAVNQGNASSELQLSVDDELTIV